ncbi:MAG: hypothetical protein KatS3mg038_2080 [Candidatus Kapaibacterium sp.]|nr:MAG: hypothetical protein KatS3mg038_2080 [Candidatus Kapabacteria bacterium]
MRPLLLLPLDCAHECLIADDGLRLWPATPPQYTTIGGFGCWRRPRAARRDHAAHGATGAGGMSAAAAERAEHNTYTAAGRHRIARCRGRSCARRRIGCACARSASSASSSTTLTAPTRRGSPGTMASPSASRRRTRACSVSHESVTIVGRDPHVELRHDAAYVYEDVRPRKLSYRRDRGRIEELLRTLGVCDA